MGNPTRYIFDNKNRCRRPDILDNNMLRIVIYCDVPIIDDVYEKVSIDMYQAPDVICNYPNSQETCKDEYHRYWRDTFHNAKLVKQDLIIDCYAVEFSFEKSEHKYFDYTNEEQISNLPIGKFAGWSIEQIKNKKNEWYHR